MRRGYIAALMISVLLLSGCGAGSETAEFEQFRQRMAAAAAEVTAEVTASEDDEVTVFTLMCAAVEDGYDVAVTEPELLAGVRAHLRTGENTLEFDGIVLPVGDLGGGLSPLTALPRVLRAAQEGHVDLLWREDGALVAQLILDDTTTVRLYLDAAGVPVAAEISEGTETVVRCDILNWNWNERGTTHESNNSNLGGDQSDQSGA